MASTPDSRTGSLQLQSLPRPLLEALEPLLERAPSGVFPRARRLYFDKYPLEGRPEDLDFASGRFRTFVLRETLKPLRSDRLAALPDRSMTPVAGSPAQHDFVRLHELAVVHWHESVHAPLDAVNLYLQERWDLHTSALELMEQSWFREGGLWVRVTLPGADPAPAEAQQQTMP